jgi:hypothetical protein
MLYNLLLPLRLSRHIVSYPAPVRCISLLFLSLSFFGTTLCAVQGQQDLPAPPPLKRVTAIEIAQLQGTKDLKARVRLSLELAEGHLANAERFTTVSQFDEASNELGQYQAVYEEALQYMSSLPDKGNKTRDAYKRIELSLRAHSPRIETIRRSTPREYAINVKTLAEYAKDAREEALNAFYGDTVLREAQPEKQKGYNTEQGRKPSSTVETKQP